MAKPGAESATPINETSKALAVSVMALIAAIGSIVAIDLRGDNWNTLASVGDGGRERRSERELCRELQTQLTLNQAKGLVNAGEADRIIRRCYRLFVDNSRSIAPSSSR